MYSTQDTYSNKSVKHSIVVLAYNQENSIRKALDSVLNQNVLPHEIIIGDDASEDNTFKIIEDYQHKYPSLIKAFQHPQNIGIFPNQNFLMEKVTGDIVSFVSGDDAILPYLFKELNDIVRNNAIELDKDFVIVTNCLNIDPNGNKVIYDNYLYKHKSPFKRRIRYSINYRGIGISASVLKKAGKIPEDIGLNADWIWSLRIEHLAKMHYYTPFISSIYYSGVGIVSKTKREKLAHSMLKVISVIKIEFKNILDSKDMMFLKLVEDFENYQIQPTFFNYIKFLFSSLLNLNNFDSNKNLIRLLNLIPKQVFEILYFLKSKFKSV